MFLHIRIVGILINMIYFLWISSLHYDISLFLQVQQFSPPARWSLLRSSAVEFVAQMKYATNGFNYCRRTTSPRISITWFVCMVYIISFNLVQYKKKLKYIYRVLKKMVGKLNRYNFCSMPDRKFYPSSFWRGDLYVLLNKKN